MSTLISHARLLYRHGVIVEVPQPYSNFCVINGQNWKGEEVATQTPPTSSIGRQSCPSEWRLTGSEQP